MRYHIWRTSNVFPSSNQPPCDGAELVSVAWGGIAEWAIEIDDLDALMTLARAVDEELVIRCDAWPYGPRNAPGIEIYDEWRE